VSAAALRPPLYRRPVMPRSSASLLRALGFEITTYNLNGVGSARQWSGGAADVQVAKKQGFVPFTAGRSKCLAGPRSSRAERKAASPPEFGRWWLPVARSFVSAACNG
jgi:hypothetical protein